MAIPEDDYDRGTDSEVGTIDSLEKRIRDEVSSESSHSIKYRTLSWPKCAALLFAEYISLALLSVPYSYNLLGFVGGILITIIVQSMVVYTSFTLWRFCMKYPDVRDICDIGMILFGGKRWAYEATMVGLVLNNVFIQGLHCLVGSIVLNTLSNHGACTVVFAFVVGFVCFLVTLPRTLAELSWLSWLSALMMGISVLTAMIFSGVEIGPNNVGTLGPVYSSATATSSNFVSQFNAMLNITYTLIGQICLPSYIAEMRDPRDFPKALWAVSIAEVVIFCVAGSVMYHYFGQYTAGSAIGSLQPPYNKISYGLAIPALIMIGVIYASVLSRFLFNRMFDKRSIHRTGHTLKGWLSWIGICAGTWTAGFIISQVIPFFNALLSVMSSLFDSWFGFIFWGVAWFHLNPGAWRHGIMNKLLALFNILLIGLGVLLLSVGTYASIEEIILEYAAGTVGSPFSCADNGFS